MCDSNAYLLKNGTEELVMENVDYVRLEGSKVLMRNIFGEEQTFEATLQEMNLTGHKILMKSP